MSADANGPFRAGDLVVPTPGPSARAGGTTLSGSKQPSSNKTPAFPIAQSQKMWVTDSPQGRGCRITPALAGRGSPENYVAPTKQSLTSRAEGKWRIETGGGRCAVLP